MGYPFGMDFVGKAMLCHVYGIIWYHLRAVWIWVGIWNLVALVRIPQTSSNAYTLHQPIPQQHQKIHQLEKTTGNWVDQGQPAKSCCKTIATSPPTFHIDVLLALPTIESQFQTELVSLQRPGLLKIQCWTGVFVVIHLKAPWIRKQTHGIPWTT